MRQFHPQIKILKLNKESQLLALRTNSRLSVQRKVVNHRV